MVTSAGSITALMVLPSQDFDPTESAVTWKILTNRNIQVVFATPDGKPAAADYRVLTGAGFGPWRPFLRADASARSAYAEMERSAAFGSPLRWDAVDTSGLNGVILPGGHASGMKPLLESSTVQSVIRQFFQQNKLVAAICHGVLAVARTKNEQGRSVLFGRKTTALLKSQELTAWAMTALWLGNYYRTYPQVLQDEVAGLLASPADFLTGSFAIRRDSASNPSAGFVVRDGNYISARWPGDAHAFGNAISEYLNNSSSKK